MEAANRPQRVTKPTPKLSLLALTAMVVGSMVGAGIFSLPRTFSNATGPFGAAIAWCIAGGGMYTLARVFQALVEREPDLDAGIYAYAKAGFGDYPGFLSAVGYWIVGCIANVSYWVLIKATLGAFFPVFGDGNTLAAVFASSIALWLFHVMISARNQRRCHRQYHRYDREDYSNLGLHPDLGREIRARSVPRELLGR